LGSGSFGRVLKVVKKDKTPQRDFAIKQIKMNELSSKEKDNALNEIRLLASIDSPYIIKYKSAFF
jgi:NIMA (never in mitosis gene a)-related kinase